LDLTITSPPYNVDLGNNKYNKNPYDLYVDNREHKEYIAWLVELFSLIRKKTKIGGRLVINIGDGKNGAVPTHSDLIYGLCADGWIPLGTIIWDKGNVTNRTAWGSFCSPSSPSFPTPFEYILIFGNQERKLQWRGETDLTKEEFISWAYGVWKFPGQKINGHPAAFPVELPLRVMKILSWKGSVVYDPFMESGTTAVACTMNDRAYVGSEISSEYYRLSVERVYESRK
jgi:site-specific DNA-methyltransferase (adenine-specific)